MKKAGKFVLFDYLDNKPEAMDLFKGEYMSQYSFAEDTLATLLGDY